MRVLVITSVFPRHEKDAEVPWLRECCRRLTEAGVEMEILAPAQRGLKSHTIDGMSVHRFRYAPAKWETLTGEEGAPSKLRRNPFLKFLAVAYLWCGFWTLVRLLCRKRYDLIEVHWPFPHAFMALPGVWAGVPLVYHYHSAELKLAAQNSFYNTFFAWSTSWARAHVTNSSYTAALLKMLNPRLAPVVIPYGSPLEMEAPAGLARPRRKILFVGRHIERKGLRYLIEALAFLPEDFTLTLAGEGDQTPALKTLAGGQPRVRFPGQLTDEALCECYLSHDFFVLPAIVDSKGDTEGLGVVLIEAVAAGLPLVGSAVGGIPDIIRDGQTGLLVEEKQPQKIANALLRLAQDEGLCQSLIANARAHVGETFSWKAVVKATLALYASTSRKT